MPELDGRALGRHDRDLRYLLDPRTLIRVEDDVDVPAGRALRTERRDGAAGQPGAQHARHLARGQAEICRLLAINVDHQLRIAGDAAIIHVDGTRHFAHKLAHLRRQRLQDLLVLALDAHRHARAAVVEHSHRGGFDDRARDVSAKRTRHIRELSWRANPLVLLLELDEDAGEPRAARAEAAVAADAHRAEDLVYLGQRKQALLDGLRRCVGHVECSAGWHLDGDLHLAVVGLGHELSAEQAGADQHDPADEGQQAGGNHNPARSSPDRDP